LPKLFVEEYFLEPHRHWSRKKYNIIYSEQKGLIPFYYKFSEGIRSGKEFYHDFLTRFYMQVVGYYMRDTLLIRNPRATPWGNI